MLLNVQDNTLTAFVGCLVIGTLHEIRRGVLDPDVGIWSLAVPRFVDPLEQYGRLPPALITVLRTCDELSLIRDLAPEKYLAVIDELIAQVEALLAGLVDQNFVLNWAHLPKRPLRRRSGRRRR